MTIIGNLFVAILQIIVGYLFLFMGAFVGLGLLLNDLGLVSADNPDPWWNTPLVFLSFVLTASLGVWSDQMTSRKVLVLPGDNIGPEIMQEAVKVLQRANELFDLNISLDYAELGGAAIDLYGEPCPEASLSKAKYADAILVNSSIDAAEKNKTPLNTFCVLLSEVIV